MSSRSTTIDLTSDEDSPTTTTCRLLSLPGELRNRIWFFALQGDGRVIHMDHTEDWSDLELSPRLNLTITCKQIQRETEDIFHAANTFLFQARDRYKNYRVLENIANWLYTLSDPQRKKIGRVVICSNQPKVLLEWAWTCAGYCEMDFGFVVGKRLDEPIVGELVDGTTEVVGYESWGREVGHFCNKGHYLLVPKAEVKKGKKRQVAVAEQ